MRKALAAGLGGVAAAFLASLCCVGPLLFVTLGVGAGLASTFEPLRPLFGTIMVILLAAGFYVVYGRRGAQPVAGRAGATSAGGGAACRHGEACDAPRRGRDIVVLWTATILALLLWTFPTWSRLFV